MSTCDPQEPNHGTAEQIDPGAALIETTLHQARITQLQPSHLVLVGDGQRVWITHDGVSRQQVADVRIVAPVPVDGTANAELQRVLADWAGGAMTLRVRESAHSGQPSFRTVGLSDINRLRVTLRQGSGHPDGG